MYFKTNMAFKVQLYIFYRVHHKYFPRWNVYNKGSEKSTLEITIPVIFFVLSLECVLNTVSVLEQLS